MTTQAYPPSGAQQLADARTASAVAQERIRELEVQVVTERARADDTYNKLVAMERTAYAIAAERVGMANDLLAAQLEVSELSRQLAELTQLVGVETPIAAFTLAETWRAERAHMQDAIEHIKLKLEGERDEARASAALAIDRWKRSEAIRGAVVRDLTIANGERDEAREYAAALQAGALAFLSGHEHEDEARAIFRAALGKETPDGA